MKMDSGRQKRRDVLSQAACQLFQHPLLGVCTGDRFSFECKVVIEAGKERVGVHGELSQAHVQVEEISILAALQERSQLGCEQFLGLKRCDVSFGLIPAVLDRIWVLLDAEHAVMFAGIDFNLNFQGGIRLGLGRKPEDKVHRVGRVLALAVAEPRESLADGVGSRTDLLALCLNQVYVFGVAKRLLEDQLVDRGAAAKRDLACQRRCVEQIAQRAADNQILLDLLRGRPWSLGAPLLNVRCGNQKSASTGSLMMSFHLAMRGASSEIEEISGLMEGSRSNEVLAILTKGSSALACGARPA